MSNETETPTRKPLKLSSPGKLELKKTVDGGQVRQSFPHGRTKTVAVEVKKKRTYTQGVGGKMTEVPSEAEQKLGLAPAPAVVEIDERHHNLTEHERVARTKALEQAKRDEDVRKQFEEEESKRAAERTEREKAEVDKRRREEEERKAAEEAAKVARDTQQAQAAAATAAKAEKAADPAH